ncbi:MAG: cobalamin biosynthesis protein [Candidatus Methanoperedens sp.]|nr:cobalamin biosynthesis protein [Candidatus Methanoperedens sp.]MCE8429340.1 cobalamin biosynthesis protein [Candidatus Methanoperedens sp.]
MNFWLCVLLLAVLFDIVIGEPPASFHPVVWMGKLIKILVRGAPVRQRKLYGFLMVFSCVGITILFGKSMEILLGTEVPGMIIYAYFLKSCFSIRMLFVCASRIKKDLEAERIEKVRTDLKTFVGRDTSQLNVHQSASAVIESLAESFVDGILAPLFYFLLFGLPGALGYRMINTLDSMVGYKKEPFADIGYASAKLDDLVNYAPARISIVFIFLASIIFANPVGAIKTSIRDHNKTASPNSGWSMAAVSGALQVKLEKIGFHVLGSEYEDPQLFHINRAIIIVGLSSLLVIACLLFIGSVPLIQL